MSRPTCLVALPVLSLLLTVTPRASAQPDAPPVDPPTVPREQVGRLVHHRATTSFAELAAIAPPGLDVIVTTAFVPVDQHGVHSDLTRGRIATIAPDGLTIAVKRRFGRWHHIPLTATDIQRVEMVRPSRDPARTRNIVVGIAGVMGLALIANRHAGAGLLVLSLPMMATMEPGQFPGAPPRQLPGVSQIYRVPTKTLYVAPGVTD